MVGIDKKNSTFKPPDIKLVIKGGSVTFDKLNKCLKLGSALIILPIKSVIFPVIFGKTASYI